MKGAGAALQAIVPETTHNTPSIVYAALLQPKLTKLNVKTIGEWRECRGGMDMGGGGG